MVRLAAVMGELRSLFARPHGEGSWGALCEALAPCLELERARWRAEVEPYVARGVAAWPLAGRVAPMSWVLRAAGGADAGPLRLAREIVLDPASGEVLWGGDAFAALVSSPDVAQITRICAPEYGLGDDAALALARSSSLGSLEALELPRNQIGSQGARFIARSNSLRALRALDLSGNEEIGPAGIAAIWEAPQSKRLRRLSIAGCRWDGDAFFDVYRPSILSATDVDIQPALDERWAQWWLRAEYM